MSSGSECPSRIKFIFVFSGRCVAFIKKRRDGRLTMASFNKGPAYGLSAEVKNKVRVPQKEKLTANKVSLRHFHVCVFSKSPGLHFSLAPPGLKVEVDGD